MISAAQAPDLLVEHDIAYDSSLMGDDMPYRSDTANGSVIELPVHWGTDDWPPFVHFSEVGYMMPVRCPSEGLAPFWKEFEAHYESGGFWVGLWHPVLTGRLVRWRNVELACRRAPWPSRWCLVLAIGKDSEKAPAAGVDPEHARIE